VIFKRYVGINVVTPSSWTYSLVSAYKNYINLRLIIREVAYRTVFMRFITNIVIAEPEGSAPVTQKPNIDHNPLSVASVRILKPISLKLTLKLSTHLLPGLLSGRLQRGFPTKILYELFVSPILLTCPSSKREFVKYDFISSRYQIVNKILIQVLRPINGLYFRSVMYDTKSA
jgi:hypothetical protein